MRGLAVGLGLMVLGGVARAATDASDPTGGDDGWLAGDHLTGDWGGARPWLDERGVTLDAAYTADGFTAHGHAAALGHVDAALTLDTAKLGLWGGGTIYALGQNNHGDGITDRVGAASSVTNLEAGRYTQLAELFLEQALLDGALRIRLGKQDANRDFGTPRFSGNFINNDFGMFPNLALPSYPTTGLGAIAIAEPVGWLALKAGVYEGHPETGGVGLDTAFHDGAGVTYAASVAVTHHFGPAGRDNGTTSIGAWGEADSDDAPDLAEPGRFRDNAGVFVQDDERIYLHPEDANDPRGLTVIARGSWARRDRASVPAYWGGSAAWHGIGPRRNDTAGVGVGYVSLAAQLGGTPGRGSEWFAEGFYKLRLTNFLSLQPDLQWFAHPGGDRRDALVAGVRFKTKL